MPDMDWLSQLVSPQTQNMSAMPDALPQNSYTPTSGSQMEADSRSSIDSILARLQASQEANHQNDRNMQWMSFFSKLASSKNPTFGGGLGEASDALSGTMGEQQKSNKLLNQQALQDELKAREFQQQLEQGKYTPVKDFYGNVTGMFEGKTGAFTPINSQSQTGTMAPVSPDEPPSSDPQRAAAQILSEQGSVPTQVGNRFDIAGRNKQTDAYNNQALAAKNVIQQLDSLDAQTGKYTPGAGNAKIYGVENWLGIPTAGANARTEADKASTQLTNAFMQANTASSRNGIGVLNFDAKGVPNADMPDDARAALIDKQKAIANSQIQRAEISNMYPRMQIANVNSIMNTYEQKNPPLQADGTANPNWMPYHDWLKAGRPNTLEPINKSAKPSSDTIPSGNVDSGAIAEAKRRGLIQ